ncbi:MAG TPA: hypothetical protein VFR87_19665 [Nocardioidaceae bacterium]|nr:hypothetical protein [Nocardioidaceae bacterium]
MTATQPSVREPTPWSALAWALTLTLVATVLLGVLTHMVFLVDALAYGVAEVISPEADLEAPDLAHYVTAFAVSSVLAVGGGLLLTLALGRTTAAGWPSPARGLAAGAASTVAAALALLLMIGINPLTLLA